jgi:hypothetical protein
MENSLFVDIYRLNMVISHSQVCYYVKLPAGWWTKLNDAWIDLQAGTLEKGLG